MKDFFRKYSKYWYFTNIFHKFSRKCDEKTHISGGWRPTWWLSIRFKRNTERAQRFSFLLWVPLTWPGVAKNACIYDVHKCSRASFSREHQTGILFFELAPNTIFLKDVFPQFWPRSVPKIARRVKGAGKPKADRAIRKRNDFRVYNFGQNAPAQIDLNCIQSGQNCSRVCAH